VGSRAVGEERTSPSRFGFEETNPRTEEGENVRFKKLFTEMLGVERTIVEGLEHDETRGVLVVHVRPDRRWLDAPRCGLCGSRASRYDNGDGRRRWRALDLGTAITFLEAKAPRVRCREHGVVVAAVPWARHSSAYTRSFEDSAAWLLTQASTSAVAALMRITWRAGVNLAERLVRAVERQTDRLGGLVRIGIDEISHRKGQRYLTIVVNLDTNELVWAAPGRDEATLNAFFEALGPKRCRRLRAVAADGADWIHRAVKRRCVDAALCLDPFHVVSWATDALDEVRRKQWNRARHSGNKEGAKALKDGRFALWKDPSDLTPRQADFLKRIELENGQLWRAYVLKEGLRGLVHLGSEATKVDFDAWIARARTSRLDPFVELADRIERHHDAIAATLRLGLSSARVESLNTKLRVIMRRAFGFHSPASIIRLALLSLGSGRPVLRSSA
jgi:transposase